MLVEDDKSLREIYGVRLLAEGYDIVSAGDGEEALAMAIKERPQLIVSDVMMPKISGFDMLDILRSTTETKDIQVIMMTALSSEEQRTRGEALGADRYLVKSQVGIEDVVRVVHEVLGDLPSAAAPATPPESAPSDSSRPMTVPAREPAPVSAEPAAAAAPAPAPAPAPVTPPEAVTPSSAPIEPPTPPAPAAPMPEPAPQTPPTDTPKPASIKTRIIQPLNDPSANSFDINQLLDEELAKEAGIDDDARPTVQTTDQEREALAKELADFEASTSAETEQGGDTTPESSEDPSTPGNVPPPPAPPVPPVPTPPVQ